MPKLDIMALAISLGTIVGLYIFLLGLMAMGGVGVNMVQSMSAIYLGYEASFTGAVTGAIWGFVDGAIAGAIIAWVYNMVAKNKR